VIVVDSSVWIDYFNGVQTAQTDALDRLLEVLQGFRREKDAERARDLLLGLDILPMLGTDNALIAASRYRLLRARGITVRKTNDVIIASYCLTYGHSLLFADRDFEPFVTAFGLRAALTE